MPALQHKVCCPLRGISTNFEFLVYISHLLLLDKEIEKKGQRAQARFHHSTSWATLVTGRAQLRGNLGLYYCQALGKRDKKSNSSI